MTAAPAEAERELAALCLGASQGAIADACGLACHTTISERIGKALSGRKGFLAALTGEQTLRLAAAWAPFRLAAIAYLNQTPVAQTSAKQITGEVRKEISEDAAMIGLCNQALSDDEISAQEAADLALALRHSIDRRADLIARLEARARREGGRS